ncbi:hypothetical protein N9I60_03725 [Planktomarina temperata]|nr:hypothetical protein [Planktomarina temperata]
MLQYFRLVGLALLLSVGVGSVSSAASFDCNKATTQTEIAICSDPELSALDERLGAAYLVAKRLNVLEKTKRDQLSWLELRDKCENVLCLRKKYLGRLVELKDFDYEYRKPLFPLEPKCNEEAYDYAEEWDNYYSPDIAFQFGKNIQKAILNKDLKAIISFIDGELEFGFRKKFGLSSSFDDILSRNNILEIMSETVDCQPVGWRGFMLGTGQIWYDCDKVSCAIRSMISTTETLKYLDSGWEVDGKTIDPYCMAYEWMSSDNFQEIAAKYEIENYHDFSSNPGLYFGKSIKNYSGIKIAGNIHDCSKNFLNKTSNQAIIESGDLSYSVLDREIENCSALSPYLQDPITKCHLVTIGEKTGGSMGTYYRYGIYGITDLPSLGESIIPLKFFDTFNDALNFIERGS